MGLDWSRINHIHHYFSRNLTLLLCIKITQIEQIFPKNFNLQNQMEDFLVHVPFWVRQPRRLAGVSCNNPYLYMKTTLRSCYMRKVQIELNIISSNFPLYLMDMNWLIPWRGNGVLQSQKPSFEQSIVLQCGSWWQSAQIAACLLIML